MSDRSIHYGEDPANRGEEASAEVLSISRKVPTFCWRFGIQWGVIESRRPQSAFSAEQRSEAVVVEPVKPERHPLDPLDQVADGCDRARGGPPWAECGRLVLYSLRQFSMMTWSSRSDSKCHRLYCSSRIRPLNDSIHEFSHGDRGRFNESALLDVDIDRDCRGRLTCWLQNTHLGCL